MTQFATFCQRNPKSINSAWRFMNIAHKLHFGHDSDYLRYDIMPQFISILALYMENVTKRLCYDKRGISIT